jgi:hypothetical protein
MCELRHDSSHDQAVFAERWLSDGKFIAVSRDQLGELSRNDYDIQKDFLIF